MPRVKDLGDEREAELLAGLGLELKTLLREALEPSLIHI